ncbi:MAG: hemerythrin domain-containing protein, partial [Chloroflexi bacterium]|nr:hemerythrin domain-containing protein [Chloroflexota bacterium]
MKITDALKGEHGVFYAQFQFINDSLSSANLSIIQSLGAMLAAALVPHAQIENEILFPALEE